MRALFALVLAILLTACGTPRSTAPEPRVVIREVAVPTAVSCIPAETPPAPTYPDPDEALRGARDAAERYQLIAAARVLRIAREALTEALIETCRRAGPPAAH